MTFIRLNRVSKHYDGVVAVDAVSLQVQEGALLVLLGRSGCGKTTTLRLIAGLERPDTGEIWLNDKPVSTAGAWVPPEKRRIGMVFQDYALFPHMTVAQNIAFALDGVDRQEQRRRIADMLDLVGLVQVEERYPHQLSGGQQQRVALARALAPAPTVVLL
ncbi:MAG TPA: ATP-binding cassette domain-containing protein, partial [Aggregatilineales bacterium]|nr:ATP-binding cassette domain-containing protein [Aggregatilineales bacterium]